MAAELARIQGMVDETRRLLREDIEEMKLINLAAKALLEQAQSLQPLPAPRLSVVPNNGAVCPDGR
jgi:hypothetical protein